MPEPETGLGDVKPRKKAGWTTYLIIGVIAVLVIGGVSLFTGGDDNGETPGNGGSSSNTPVTIPQLKSSLDSLTATVDGFSGRIANLETDVASLTAPSITQADIDSLQASINSLTTELAVLNATVANFTDNGGGGNGTDYLGEITTWTARSCYLENVPTGVNMSNITVSVGHRDRIKEEGSYELNLQIENTGGVPFNLENANAIIVLSPRDACVIDEGATYLDCDSEPWLLWDSEVVTRTREGQEVCKRIEFTSDSFKYGSGGWSTTLGANITWNIDLVFELYYA